jgi:glucosyl-dolichyl phosphate glucuronosyltransferase
VTVSIIICTRNRADNLRQTLVSMDSVDVPVGLNPEILVVDNGSTDGTAMVVKRHKSSKVPIMHVFEATPGLSHARNTGLSRSKGDVILFTDDDLRFPKTWLSSMTTPIVEQKADAVGGSVELAPHLLRPWMKLTHRTWLASTERFDPSEPRELVGANMAFSRKILDTVPSFDTELGAGALGFCEDTLFSWQLRKAGFKISEASDAKVIHHLDVSRILRSNWLSAAKARGRSLAYLLHHWEHGQIGAPKLVATYLSMKLRLRRVVQPPPALDQEGVPLWEMSYVMDIDRCRQFAVERSRPRHYGQFGLKKNNATEG